MITEEMLRRAAAKTSDAHIDHLEQGYDSDHQHEFSPEFEKKLKKLKGKADHPFLHRNLQRAAAIFLAVLIFGGTWLAVDTTARAAFFSWVKEIYGMYFVYHIEDGDHQGGEGFDYRPTWLPDGYTELFADESEDTIMVAYANQRGEILKFNYSHTAGEKDWFVDVSQVVIKRTTINGNQAEVLMAKNADTASAIMWTGEGNTAFYLSGFLRETDLIKVAESVRKIIK